MNKKYITKGSLETEKLGEDFAKDLKPGSILCLYGDLGAGKTTFVKGFAKGLGISDRIISPTFPLIREHDLPDGKKFYHIDLYRIQNQNELKELGLKELFSDPNAIVVIEWAEKINDLLPQNRIQIMFKHATGSADEREITVEKYE